MRGLVLIICCLILPAQAAENGIQYCLALAARQTEKKLDLQKSCPALFRTLQNQRILPTFEPPLSAEISLAQLAFIAESRHAWHESSLIRRDGLDQLLAEILESQTDDPESAWRQAFLTWLDSMKTGDYEQQYQWLLRFIEAIEPSTQTLRRLIYGMMALVVIASLWLVLRELPLAKLLARLNGFRGARLAHVSGEEKQSRSPVKRLANRALPPRRQIADLLEQVIAVLAGHGRIPQQASLTHRQIARHLGPQAVPPDALFARLMQAAEPVLYGNRPVDTQTLSDFRRDAATLLRGYGS